jgi:transcriptional regulator with XRE-family HTH domain
MNTGNEMTKMSKEAGRNAVLKKEVGLRFKEFRLSIKKSQTKLADEFTVSQTTIASIENGNSFPGIPFQNYLYSQYSLNLNWLLTGGGEMILTGEKDSKTFDLPILFWHIAENDPRFEKYIELISLMHMPCIEQIILGKLAEIKIIAEKKIKSFFEGS